MRLIKLLHFLLLFGTVGNIAGGLSELALQLSQGVVQLY
jgi:hypothetical protein